MHDVKSGHSEKNENLIFGEFNENSKWNMNIIERIIIGQGV